MKTATIHLVSTSPYSQSRYYTEPKLERELDADYRRRTWRHHMHCTEEGQVYIPPMALKNCLSEAAKFLSLSVPGKGKATYTKNFEAGVLVIDGPLLGVHRDKVASEDLFLPSDGRRGSGKRVTKIYPVIPKWECDATFYILDDILTEDVFKKHLECAGQFIGIGRFRPRQNGYYGRFQVASLEWAKV